MKLSPPDARILGKFTLHHVAGILRPALSAMVGFITLFICWQLLSDYLLPADRRWLLPPPSESFTYILEHFPSFLEASLATGSASALGLFVGALAGFIIAIFFHLVPSFERTLLPFVSTLPAVPIVSIAPLIAVWFGFGLSSRIVIVAFITFFPVLVTVLAGLSSGYRPQREYCLAIGAPLGKRLLYMDLPAALGYFAAGLKAAAPVAVVGAIVAEYVAPKNGLGYLVLTNALRTNVVGVVASALACAGIGLLFVGIVNIMCKVVLARFPAD